MSCFHLCFWPSLHINVNATIFDKVRVMLPVRTACLDGLSGQNCISLRRKCIDEIEIPLILQVLATSGFPVVDVNAAHDPLVILQSEDEHLLSTPCFEDDYRRHLSCHQPPQTIGKGAGLANAWHAHHCNPQGMTLLHLLEGHIPSHSHCLPWKHRCATHTIVCCQGPVELEELHASVQSLWLPDRCQFIGKGCCIPVHLQETVSSMLKSETIENTIRMRRNVNTLLSSIFALKNCEEVWHWSCAAAFSWTSSFAFSTFSSASFTSSFASFTSSFASFTSSFAFSTFSSASFTTSSFASLIFCSSPVRLAACKSSTAMSTCTCALSCWSTASFSWRRAKVKASACRAECCGDEFFWGNED